MSTANITSNRAPFGLPYIFVPVRIQVLGNFADGGVPDVDAMVSIIHSVLSLTDALPLFMTSSGMTAEEFTRFLQGGGNKPPPPASKEVMENLPRISIQEETLNKQKENICSIC